MTTAAFLTGTIPTEGERHRDMKALCVRAIHIMSDGSLADFEAVCHPDAVNHEAGSEPVESRGRGPLPFYATALWLRQAFADLRWDVHRVVAEDHYVTVHCTMSGRHDGVFVTYDENAMVDQAFPPTGKRFATTQTHWFRVAEGRVIEHWANRDDLGTAAQLGWAPPSPFYLIRMAAARRRARRAASAAPPAGMLDPSLHPGDAPTARSSRDDEDRR